MCCDCSINSQLTYKIVLWFPAGGFETTVKGWKSHFCSAALITDGYWKRSALHHIMYNGSGAVSQKLNSLRWCSEMKQLIVIGTLRSTTDPDDLLFHLVVNQPLWPVWQLLCCPEFLRFLSTIWFLETKTGPFWANYWHGNLKTILINVDLHFIPTWLNSLLQPATRGQYVFGVFFVYVFFTDFSSRQQPNLPLVFLSLYPRANYCLNCLFKFPMT